MLSFLWKSKNKRNASGIFVIVAIFGFIIFSSIQGVVPDDTLLQRGVDAYNGSQEVEALRYLFAYQQRDPQFLKDNPEFAVQIAQIIVALKVSLENTVHAADTLRSALDQCEGRPHMMQQYQKMLLTIPLAKPNLISPIEGKVFDHYPRKTTLTWEGVDRAATYTVEIDCFGCCALNKWCSDVGGATTIVKDLTTIQYTFNFVGAQPGRWRVWGVDRLGRPGTKSEWRTFRYTK